jgi:hypothetical protein
LSACLGVFLSGCAEPQRPYEFRGPPMAREPIEALAASMQQAGYPPVVVDPQTGSVHTRWIDTKVPGEKWKDRDTTIVRRYTAKLQHGAFGNDVTLSAEAQRCVVLEFNLTEISVQGECLPMESLIPRHLEELYQLGQRVQQAMNIP